MKSNVFGKKFPTILGLLLLLGGIPLAIFLIRNRFFLPSPSEIETALEAQDIRVTNIQNDKFTVSWLTTSPSKGVLKHGTSSSLERQTKDDRDVASGEEKNYKNHFVTLKNLTSKGTYYIQIAAELPRTVSTGPNLTSQGQTKIIRGKILKADQNPSPNTIVYVSATNMASLSVLTNSNGEWAVGLHQARTKDLTSWATFDLQASVLKIEAMDGDKNTQATILTRDAFNAIPDLVLGHAPYDFRDQPRVPTQMVVSGSESTPSSSLVTIGNPAQQGEQINTPRPEFFGQGPAYQVINITIESEPITSSVTIDENGAWSFVPDSDLEPGEHTISVSFADEDGETQTIARNFVVLAAEESDLPALTATPSASIAPPPPSPSPDISPSPEATSSVPPRVSAPTTEGGVPVTGVSWPTMLLLAGGILIIILGILV